MVCNVLLCEDADESERVGMQPLLACFEAGQLWTSDSSDDSPAPQARSEQLTVYPRKCDSTRSMRFATIRRAVQRCYV